MDSNAIIETILIIIFLIIMIFPSMMVYGFIVHDMVAIKLGFLFSLLYIPFIFPSLFSLFKYWFENGKIIN